MRNPYANYCLIAALSIFITAYASAQIVITEIMYNPASKEKMPAQTEWIEIYNSGDEAVNISGWTLSDEDGKTNPVPDGISLAAGEAIVIIPGVQDVADFRAAWGEGFQVISLSGFTKGGMRGLANSPSDTNEILKLQNTGGDVVDEVNFDDVKPWPNDRKQGPSIYLATDKISAEDNDSGENWKRSEVNKDGAINNKITDDYDKTDTGSPGRIVQQNTGEENAKPKPSDEKPADQET
ncbi:lamin tail domain-containing protein [Poriferisphaera sp. WC338]|uniref:lamin tail domain-containing protein n=1 Tax=Poriferisphaera sp. WC338 TaxID=3425129 RepID=UPI003D817BC4